MPCCKHCMFSFRVCWHLQLQNKKLRLCCSQGIDSGQTMCWHLQSMHSSCLISPDARSSIECHTHCCLLVQLALYFTGHCHRDHTAPACNQQIGQDGQSSWATLEQCSHRWMRGGHRAVRKGDKQRDEQRAALGLPEAVKLLAPSAEDAEAASLVVFGDPNAFEKNWRKSRQAIQTQSIFRQPVSAQQKPAGQHSSVPGTGSKRKSVGDLAAALAKRRRTEGKRA